MNPQQPQQQPQPQQPITQPDNPQANPQADPQASGQNDSSSDSNHDSKQELRQAIHGAHEVLCTATTLFPFTLFPDTVTLDRAKLTITRRTFVGMAEVMSIRIEDILNVTASIGPFLGSVKIVSRVFNVEKPYVVDRFKRQDALLIKRVTQGYVIALQRNIDCSSLPVHELAAMLEQLGTDAHDV